MNGAAAEKSPGHVDLAEPQALGRPDGDAALLAASTRTPAASSISSVWSRVGSGSTTVVGPAAYSPASSTHDLTWALATGSS